MRNAGVNRMLRGPDSGEETLSTLNYAARAKTIRLNASLDDSMFP